MDEIKSTTRKGWASSFEYERGRIGCLLIHGFTGSPLAFQSLGRVLRDHDITVRAPLLPGHGTEPRDLIETRWTEWIACARENIRDLQRRCDRVFLIGHSMGGAIVLYLAGECNVAGVITLSAPLEIDESLLWLIPIIRPFKRYWKKKRPSSSRLFPDQLEYDRYPLSAVLQLCEFLGVLRGRLEKVKAPVLVLHARGDRRIHHHNAEWIHARVSSHDKRKILLDDPCHLIMLGNDRDRVEEEVVRFIDAHAFPMDDASESE